MILEARRTDDPYNSMWLIIDAAGEEERLVGQIVIVTDDPAVALSEWQAAIALMDASDE